MASWISEDERRSAVQKLSRETGMNSALYECSVFHRRLSPKKHEFRYRIFLFWIDLDELEQLSRRIPIFSCNRANLYSFRDQDYFSVGHATARENAVAYLKETTGCAEPAKVCLLTLPRFVGYTFNPISIFYFYDDADAPATASLVQVGNTFRELKPYSVPATPNGPTPFYRRVTKHFYVSPFSELDLEFDFRFFEPEEKLRVLIDDYAGDQKVLLSSLTGERRPLTFGSLAWMTLKYPFITLKVIGAIHWEALRLWIKRVPHRRKEAEPDLQRDVHNPHRSIK